MKKHLLLSLFACFAIAMQAADPVNIDGIWYQLSSVGGNNTASVQPVTTGGMSYTGNITIPESVKSVEEVEYAVTSIAKEAFKGCTNLTKVSIPSSINFIENDAFSGCYNLTDVTLLCPAGTTVGINAFYGCQRISQVTFASAEALFQITFNGEASNPLYKGAKFAFVSGDSENIVIPSGITEIKANALVGSKQAFKIAIPEGVTTINNNAFQNCTGLTNVFIPSTVNEIKASAFQGCSSLTSVGLLSAHGATIGINAFKDCPIKEVIFANADALFKMDYKSRESNPLNKGAEFSFMSGDNSEIETPLGITEINAYVLAGSKQEFSLRINNGVKTINESAFNGCIGLTDVSIPSTVNDIKASAFEKCSSMTSVELLSDGATIGINAFKDCQRIKTVKFANAEALFNIEYKTEASNPLYMGATFTFDSGSASAVVIPSGAVTEIKDYALTGTKQVFTLTIPEGVTTIGNNAFKKCSELTAVSFPSTLSRIKSDAFNSCAKLSKVTYKNEEKMCLMDYETATSNPLGNSAHLYFDGISAEVDNISFKNGLKDGNTIKQYALYGAKHIKTVTIPSAVTTIEKDAFKGCNLQSVTYASKEQIYSISYREDENENSFGANPVNYAQDVIVGGDYVHDLEINKDIEDYTFQNATWLRTVKLTEGVSRIGKNAFSGCTNLSSIGIDPSNDANRLPSSVNYIGESAFEKTALTNIAIPNENCELGVNMFYQCRKLSDITLPKNIKEIPERMFYDCTSLKELTLPESLEKIGDKAFFNCDKITTKLFDDCIGTLKTIGQLAFCNCSGFANLILGDNEKGKVSVIDAKAFQDCKNITMISLPATIEKIREGAFEGCTSLMNVYVHSKDDGIPATEANIFGGRETEMNLYVYPETAIAIYQAKKPWKDFKSTTKKEMHTISFNINGVHQPALDITLYSGDIISEEETDKLKIADKEGRTFSGWFNKEWSNAIPSTMPGVDVVFNGYFIYEASDANYKYTIYPTGADGKDGAAKATVAGLAKELKVLETLPDIPTTVTFTNTDYPSADGVEDFTVKEIGTEAFKDQKFIQSITLPATITTIGEGAFIGCTGISNIAIPASVDSIGKKAFSGCTGLTRVDGFKLTKVSDEAFLTCQKLSIIDLSGVTEIGNKAFTNCLQMTFETLPAGLTKIGYQALSGTGVKTLTIRKNIILDEEVFKYCTKLENVVFEEGFTQTLPKLTFWGCTNLKNFTLAKGMRIGDGAFKGCTGLTALTEAMLNQVEEIGSDAFMDCNKLTSITLPSSLSILSSSAFACPNLDSKQTPDLVYIIAKGNTPPQHGAFDAFDSRTYQNEKAWVYVNKGMTDAYKAKEPWKYFKTNTSTDIRITDGDQSHTLTYVLDGETYKKDDKEQVFEVMVGTPLAVLPDAVATDKADRPFSGWIGGLDDKEKPLPVPDVMPNEDTTVWGRFKYEVKFYDGEPMADNSNRLLTGEAYPDGFWYWFGENYTLPFDQLHRDEYLYTITLPSGETAKESKNEEDMDKLKSMSFTMGKADVAIKVVYEKDVDEITEGGIVFEIKISDDMAVVKGITNLSTTNVVIPATVTYNKKAYQVKEIVHDAFANNNIITSISLGNVETIGNHAFYKCLNLSEIKNGFPKVVSIGDAAFCNTKLTDVTIPGNVKEMGPMAFYGCNSLERVTVKAENISERAFAKCVNLNALELDNVKTIGNSAFDNCSKLTTLSLPTSLKQIGEYAFDNVFGMGDIIEVKATTAGAFPEIKANTFDDNAYQNAELHTSVSSSALPEAWENFKNVEPLAESLSSKCQTPEIAFSYNTLSFTCATSGATIVYSIKAKDDTSNTAYDPNKDVTINKEYVVTAYAKKSGMQSSDIAELTIKAVLGDVDGDGKVDVSDYIGVANIILNGKP